jgi:hypothetical protein
MDGSVWVVNASFAQCSYMSSESTSYRSCSVELEEDASVARLASNINATVVGFCTPAMSGVCCARGDCTSCTNFFTCDSLDATSAATPVATSMLASSTASDSAATLVLTSQTTDTFRASLSTSKTSTLRATTTYNSSPQAAYASASGLSIGVITGIVIGAAAAIVIIAVVACLTVAQRQRRRNEATLRHIAAVAGAPASPAPANEQLYGDLPRIAAPLLYTTLGPEDAPAPSRSPRGSPLPPPPLPLAPNIIADVEAMRLAPFVALASQESSAVPPVASGSMRLRAVTDVNSVGSIARSRAVTTVNNQYQSLEAATATPHVYNLAPTREQVESLRGDVSARVMPPTVAAIVRPLPPSNAPRPAPPPLAASVYASPAQRSPRAHYDDTQLTVKRTPPPPPPLVLDAHAFTSLKRTPT